MATKINGIEKVQRDETAGDLIPGYNYQVLVGAACDAFLASRGLPVGQFYKAQQFRNYKIGRGAKRKH